MRRAEQAICAAANAQEGGDLAADDVEIAVHDSPFHCAERGERG